jgi:hypothetical protein
MHGHDTERWNGWKPGDPTPIEIDVAKSRIRAGRTNRHLLDPRHYPVRHVNMDIYDEVTLERVA